MDWKRIGLVAALVGAGLGVAGCADRYGYGGVSAGYGYADGYAGGYGYGDPYGYGYGDPSYFGWYGDYYYPGTGIYVYDRYRRPFRWNDGQRRFWQGRRDGYRGNGGVQNNWNGFDRRGRQGYGNAYPGRGPVGRPGVEGGYSGRGTVGAAPFRPNVNRNGYATHGDGERRYFNGGRYLQGSAPSVSAPQGVPPASRLSGGGRSPDGSGRHGGRGRRY